MGGDAAKQRKLAALQNEVSALEAALEAARREYDRVKARNLQVCVLCGWGRGEASPPGAAWVQAAGREERGAEQGVHASGARLHACVRQSARAPAGVPDQGAWSATACQPVCASLAAAPAPARLPARAQELERTRAERSAAFSRLSRGLAEVDALYAQRCAEIWAGVADDFGAPGGSGGASGSGGGGGW